ncbi:MAG: hypothetical protein LC794_11485 [Acidobacteria bacterium]|nr:hypothetical protein [Acidobacteriota bacterium]MCA1627289.1 hypothetical protein [Acidobacteriota bacterium]
MSNSGIGCESLRVWSRLETRARRVDFETALQARVHDPLWMLARQWQFGEFKGEDSGSPITAKLARRTTPLSGLRSGAANTIENYSGAVPLETAVEKLPLNFSVVDRAQMGRRFLALAEAAAKDLPQGAPAFDFASYRGLFRRVFPITITPLNAQDPADALSVAQRRTDTAAHRMQQALAGRSFDGLALASALLRGISWASLPTDLALGVIPQHADLFLGAFTAFRDWFAKLYAIPAAADNDGWNNAQLEYQFACSFPHDAGTSLVLGADDYASGRLDWYSFDQGAPAPNGQVASTTDVRTVIPSPAEFAGMPNARWWQFEDGAVDLGHIRAESSDVAKIAVAEFALLFGNNWFVIPCRQRVGVLAEIEGIVITDVFGWRTSVAPAMGSSAGVWTQWDFFSLAPRSNGPASEPLGQHLLLPPTLGHVLESEPVESAAFVRDEMTNTVWAVETRVHDGLGSGCDGATRARRFRNTLDSLERSLRNGDAEPPVIDPEAVLRYRLGTTVAENWIPFVPVHKPRDTRAIRLQRASMPRFFLDSIAPIRPLTGILRSGLRHDNTQERPYFINEEEVTRAGVVVEATLQRARWQNGSTVVWYGRRKKSGRGEVDSGLRFDVIEPV